jgi:predicted DNA-binding protein (MmcQ/YjbR family)
MNIEEFRDYCLQKPDTEETFPFDESTLVYKVLGKMYAATGLNEIDSFRVNLKCDPEKAIQLRERYPEIIPGYHMNKKHWNTVYFDGALSNKLLLELIDHSYDLVVAGLPKKRRDLLNGA